MLTGNLPRQRLSVDHREPRRRAVHSGRLDCLVDSAAPLAPHYAPELAFRDGYLLLRGLPSDVRLGSPFRWDPRLELWTAEAWRYRGLQALLAPPPHEPDERGPREAAARVAEARTGYLVGGAERAGTRTGGAAAEGAKVEQPGPGGAGVRRPGVGSAGFGRP